MGPRLCVSVWVQVGSNDKGSSARARAQVLSTPHTAPQGQVGSTMCPASQTTRRMLLSHCLERVDFEGPDAGLADPQPWPPAPPAFSRPQSLKGPQAWFWDQDADQHLHHLGACGDTPPRPLESPLAWVQPSVVTSPRGPLPGSADPQRLHSPWPGDPGPPPSPAP